MALDLSPQSIIFEVGSTGGRTVLSLSVGDLRFVKVVSLNLPPNIADCVNYPLMGTEREDEERGWFDFYAAVSLGKVHPTQEREVFLAWFREYAGGKKRPHEIRGGPPFISNRHPRANELMGKK